MTILNQIRYFLFAIAVLGCFANFAQNEYGLTMLYGSMLFIALIFFIEAFIFYSKHSAEKKLLAYYLFAEHFILGCIFLGNFFKRYFILPPGFFLVFGAAFLSLLYLAFGLRFLFKETRKGTGLALTVFFFILSTICAVNALSFKLQQLPGANILIKTAACTGIIIIILMVTKMKFTYKGEIITLGKRSKALPGKIRLVFFYFTIWAIYISLSLFDLVPRFYTLSNPPAYEKLRTHAPKRAEIYDANYYHFLQNRNHIQYK